MAKLGLIWTKYGRGCPAGTVWRLGSGTPSKVRSLVLVCWSTAISKSSFTKKYPLAPPPPPPPPLKDGNFICSVYDKRDKFKFSVVRLTPRFSNQLDNVGYCTFASQVIRFTRICNNIDGVRVRILFLFNLFVSLGFDPCKLIKTFTNCINRHKFSEKFKTIGHILSPTSI